MVNNNVKVRELYNLPPEMLLKIFENIPAKDLLLRVQFVCRKFHYVIKNECWWLHRLQQSEDSVHLSAYEVSCNDFSASRSCYEYEEEKERWSHFHTQKRRVGQGHIASVDAVRLFTHKNGMYCLSGSRDHTIRLWNVDKIAADEDPATWTEISKWNAHSVNFSVYKLQNEGWIWHIDEPVDESFLSCGWDSKVKLWSLTPSDITEVSELQLRSAATAVIRRNNICVCSTYQKKVCLLDPRDKLKIQSEYAFHGSCVISLAFDGNYVYSCGSDKKLVLADVRNVSKPLKQLISQDYIHPISVARGLVYGGTVNGKILCLRSDNLNLIQNTVWTTGTRPVKILDSGDLGSEPSRFDYSKGHLVISGGEGDLSFWTAPRPS